MVYKKYIKRNGKVFGPYYYESYRENGKVKTRFISGPKSKDKINWKKWIIGIVLLLIIVGAGYYFWNDFGINGKVIAGNIISIISADKFDGDGNFVGNIFNLVNNKDDKWALIEDGESIKIEFEKELESDNDISFYARSKNGGRVDVYPENGDLLMSFDVKEDKLYKKFLEGLKKTTSIFYLKIIGDIEFDYIFDPEAIPERAWNSTFGEGDAIESVAYGIATSNKDSVYVVGTYDGAWQTIKYNATNGSLIFERYYTDDNDDVAYDVAVDAAENIYVTGYYSNDSAGYGGQTIKYNSSGALNWTNAFVGDGAVQVLYGVAVDNQSSVYVAGVANYSGTNDTYLIRYNSTNGSNIWNVSYNVGTGHEVAHAVDVDNKGFVYIAGSDGTSKLIVKYNVTDGSYVYNITEENVTGEENFLDIVYDSDALYALLYDFINHAVTIYKYNATNQSVIWSKSQAENAVPDFSRWGIDINSKGYAYVAGDDDGYFTLFKFNNSDGNLIWNTTMTDFPGKLEAISLDSNDDIYVAGTKDATGAEASLIVTMKFDSSTLTSVCKVLDTANAVYNQNADIINNSLTDNCFNITAENVTFNGNGYYISSDDNYAGIYSDKYGTKVNGVNISMNNTLGGYGVHIKSNNAGNCIIQNSLFDRQYSGIFLEDGVNCVIRNNIVKNNLSNIAAYTVSIDNSSDSSLINNTILGNGSFALVLYNSINIKVLNNTIRGNSSKIFVINSSNNSLFSNNSVNSSRIIGDGNVIYLRGSTNNTFINNTIKSSNNSGIYMSKSVNNSFVGTIVKNNGSSVHGIILNTSSHENYFLLLNSTALGSSGAAVYIHNSSNNTFVDSINLEGNPSDIVYSPNSHGQNNVFINCSFSNNNETVDGPKNELVRKWYYQALVKCTTGEAISGANVSAYNVTNGMEFSVLTNASGYTPRMNITDYVNLENNVSYYSNYIINATDGTDMAQHEYNVTFYENNLTDVFEISCTVASTGGGESSPDSGSALGVDPTVETGAEGDAEADVEEMKEITLELIDKEFLEEEVSCRWSGCKSDITNVDLDKEKISMTGKDILICTGKTREVTKSRPCRLIEEIKLTKVVLEEFVETVDGVKLRKIEQIMTISHEDQISAIITQIINPVTGGTEAVDLNFV